MKKSADLQQIMDDPLSIFCGSGRSAFQWRKTVCGWIFFIPILCRFHFLFVCLSRTSSPQVFLSSALWVEEDYRNFFRKLAGIEIFLFSSFFNLSKSSLICCLKLLLRKSSLFWLRFSNSCNDFYISFYH